MDSIVSIAKWGLTRYSHHSGYIMIHTVSKLTIKWILLINGFYSPVTPLLYRPSTKLCKTQVLMGICALKCSCLSHPSCKYKGEVLAQDASSQRFGELHRSDGTACNSFLHIVGSNTAVVKICSVSVWCPIFDITMLEKDTKTRTLNIWQIIVYALMVTSCLTRNQSGACALEIFPPTSFK